jgi:hypothetical protein
MRAWRTDDPPRASARLVRLADVQAERVTWIDRGRLPLGKLVLLDGDPGLGKTLITLDYAARVSSGRGMPDGSSGDLTEPGGVVILTAEDGLGDTVRPRLEAAGADLERIVVLDAVTDGTDERMPTAADVPAITEAIAAVKAKLVIIDPLMAYLPSATDAYRDQDVRRLLAALSRVAADTGAALLVVRHLTKAGGGGNPLYRGGGSIGIIGAARVGLMVAPDPDDDTGERRIVAPTKSNLARAPAALAYRITDVDGVPSIRWEGQTAHTAAGLVAATMATSDAPEERSRVAEAERVVRELLTRGPVLVTEARAQLRAAGVADRTADRARTRLAVEARPDGYQGAWRWHPPRARTPGETGESGETVNCGDLSATADGETGQSSQSRHPAMHADGGETPPDLAAILDVFPGARVVATLTPEERARLHAEAASGEVAAQWWVAGTA